jgi:o-succinylbenzoate synthase
VVWGLTVDSFAPALLEVAWHRPTEVPEAFTGLPREPSVQSGLDMGCWDLWSRRRGTPLAHALGGERTAITAGVTIGRQSGAECAIREVNRQVGSGVLRVRLDIGPGWDVEVVRAVRDAYPFLALQVDAAGRYRECDEDLDALRALDGFGLLAIEEPFGADLAAHARLRGELRTPIALGESLDCAEALEAAVAAHAADVMNLRVAHVGGLTVARRMHDRARDAGWQMWCGSDGESAVGRAAAVALASLPGVTLPSEAPGAGSGRGKGPGLMRPPVRAHEGIVPVPLTQPGLGHLMDLRVLDELTIRHARLHS